MPAKKSFVPKYCLHKPSGRAYCRIQGKVVYLGRHGSPESKTEYGRVVSEFATNPTATAKVPASITVVELADAYWQHAQRYYRGSDGSLPRIRVAIRSICEHYAHKPVDEFGPLALQAVRQRFIGEGRSRVYTNHIVGAIKRVFRWGSSQELVPVSTYQALATVAGLQKGRTEAAEPSPIGPVHDDAIDATLPHMSEIVADMARLQRLCGCRPAEVCVVRPCDVDTSGDVWTYQPESHKTQYRGHDRMIFIGPKAQVVLRPYLLRGKTDYCFSPIESEKRRLALLHAARKTPLAHGNRPGTNRRKNPKKQVGECYGTYSYRQVIHRAIDKANKLRTAEAADMGIEPVLIPRWSPNQLRHTKATEVRRKFGLEAAQVLLGHARADVTQVYAERDTALAVEVSRKIG